MQDNPDISLNADQLAVTAKTIQDVQFAMATIADSLKRTGAVDAQLATSVLRVSEHYLADLGKLLGIPTQTAQEIEERSARLREANLRIRALEKQLGDVQAPALTQLSLNKMADQLNAWWDLEGFGHVSNIHFGAYGCEVDFCCHLFGNFRVIDSDTPVSDKERKRLWHENLAERGFVLTNEGREVAVCDCDQSRKVLMELFAVRLPSASVRSFDNHYKKGSGATLEGVKVFVRDIAEFLALPVPVKDNS